ncbi:hypothetical protein JOC77_001981 [Peribacillus deserti]|uniref:YrhK domain-containing protein n=1 Tax=Peribacillus deserti TaxID=673318 RepID=A0ABS2QHB3_9BACI|nr:hypothetical protein [Peribacillus deserti]MBM7692551.1 hypothetical protein [Peribacillus deserti]
MRIYNKQEVLQRHPDLIREVFGVWESNIFVYLDLMMFSVLFSLMLLATGRPLYVTVGVPAIFFAAFTVVYKLLLCSKDSPQT